MKRDELAWRQALSAVRATIADEGIVCTPERLAVPPSSKDRFYDLVSQVQTGLTREVLGESLADSEDLSARCRSMKERIENGSGLSELALPSAVERFIEDPGRALGKAAFCCVMDCIQTRGDERSLLEASHGELTRVHASLSRFAYEFWVYFGIVAALEPVRFWLVESPDTVQTFAVPAERVSVGHQVTSPERRIPDAVFETGSGRLFALKNEPARELDFYGVKIKRRRDMSLGGNSADQLAHRVLMLYEVESIASVPLIADRDKLMIRPVDLMVEVLSKEEMRSPSYAAQIAARYRSVPSRRPIQVVTLERGSAFPDGFEADPTIPAYELVAVDNDEARLVDIAGLIGGPGRRIERTA